MLSSTGFDLWAGGYDRAVGLSDEENTYPFAGYREVLARIARTVMEKDHPAVLDLGFGTATLTSKLYEQGCRIYGQDFSGKMLETARAKMPEAELVLGDLTEGLAANLKHHRYDFIISTYAMHHLTDEQKIAFLSDLRSYLLPGGQILIGDVAFESRSEMDACRQTAGEEWDDEEIYLVAEDMRKAFPDLTFRKVTFCAGILCITSKEQEGIV
ncbi:MAG: class I SAM-dependent methyltransferase [Clostridia bacterium]|nr:class I SAM-dependent methyltransferase [Clostridia bacterium]